ncbi:unnamed protein product [Durusdinium trenchii]|uniref:Uncharacterized protein n=2 Tax=Durusdinium trenchii TaxID=1381693 RepID=A0ABP0Q163_9DINO
MNLIYGSFCSRSTFHCRPFLAAMRIWLLCVYFTSFAWAANLQKCSGTGPLRSSVPVCYFGETSGEAVLVKILSFDSLEHAGQMELRAAGASKVACESTFTQEGQAIQVRQLCLPSSVSAVNVSYCSDQDALRLDASVEGDLVEMSLRLLPNCQPLMRRSPPAR